MLNCLYVGIGGFVGSVLRYLIGLLPINPSNGFPLKTFAINIIGCFVLGIISAIAGKNENINPQLILMLRVGVCGGFTTFSTFAYETCSLIQNGSTWIAVLYMLMSVLLGIAAVFAAILLVK